MLPGMVSVERRTLSERMADVHDTEIEIIEGPEPPARRGVALKWRKTVVSHGQTNSCNSSLIQEPLFPRLLRCSLEPSQPPRRGESPGHMLRLDCRSTRSQGHKWDE